MPTVLLGPCRESCVLGSHHHKQLVGAPGRAQRDRSLSLTGYNALDLGLPFVYLDEHGLVPGRTVQVLARDAEGTVTVAVDGSSVPLTSGLSQQLFVALPVAAPGS